MRLDEPIGDRGAGILLVADEDSPDEWVGLKRRGDAFPRFVLYPDGGTGGVARIFVGDGTIWPDTPLEGGGGGGGGMSAAEILAALVTVDGPGSGLDADLLDGQSSAYYATATSVTDHTGDTTAAHAASAISADSTTLVGTGTDVQAVLEELDNGIADHLADSSDAHDASAISIADAGTYFTGSDVEAVTQEIGAALALTATQTFAIGMAVALG